MNSTDPPFAHSIPKLHPTPIVPFMSDKLLSLFLPLAVYWLYSGFFHLVSIYKVPLFEKHRIRTLYEMETKNKVSLGEVIRGVLLQQFLQTLLGLIVVVAEEDVFLDDAFEMKQYSSTLSFLGKRFGFEKYANDYQHMIVPVLYWYLMPVLRFLVAMLFIDTWQYFMHRLFHQNAFLYRHIHSRHHRLYAPYAFGALYNHPLEGFLMDSVGVSLGFKLSGMSTRGAMLLFFFATIKTVDDHCGYDLPFNPIQRIFGNNAAYHDIHHQSYGIKSNFSQPFFTIWDRVCGTYMPHPPPKGSLQNDETTNIHEVSPKSNSVSENKDDKKPKKERTTATESSSIKYNLRPRKAASSL